ncbi:MAG TPA: PKD domain-containing protein [Verrucomicrobiae bacterium]|nr:PKD domain-containing protein [Verrucomicrobiae bacterium]
MTSSFIGADRRLLVRLCACLVCALAPSFTASASTNGLCLTPPMGWNSWNRFGCSVNETVVRGIADAMATNGMKAAGYQYVNIDDCWASYRDTNGVIVADTNSFPSGIKALADYVHADGLKFGIYSAQGTITCAGRPGSCGYEDIDANTYAAWGVDYLKFDNCGRCPLVSDYPVSFGLMRDALSNCGRPIVYSICVGDFENWMPVDGNLWRTTLDMYDQFSRVLAILDENNLSAAYAGPGGWNDPDMLEVGNGGMSDTEDQSQFSMWCVVAAPLIAGNDLRNMSPTTRGILTNPEVIAVDQDPAGIQGTPVAKTPGVGGTLEVWCKPLGTNSTTKAVALFNRSLASTNITVTWSEILLPCGTASVRDLWARSDLGTFANSYSAVIPSHGVQLLKIVSTQQGLLACFTASPTSGVAPLAVTFTDTSAGAITNWYWDFGDGHMTNTTAKSLVHTYATGGVYTVTEIVTGSGGSATNTSLDYITALEPSADFTATPTSGVIPLTVIFTDESVGTFTNWYWSFGDGSTTNVATQAISHVYTTAGTYTVTEIVSGPGETLTDTETNYITATWPPPVAGFTASPTIGLTPLTVIFTDTSTGSPITNWSWDFGDGAITNVTTTTVSHTYSVAGTYMATEAVSGPGGSSANPASWYVTVLGAGQYQAWQTQYFGCGSCPAAQIAADADGTGQDNAFKYVAGLDPTNPASVFVVRPAGASNAPGQFTFQFAPVVAGRVYAPQFCTNLSGGVWFPLADYAGPTTNNGQVTITDLAATQPSEFYRVGIAMAAAPSLAQELSKTNLNDLTHFWTAVQTTNRPVTVVSFGDSVANSYASPSFSVMNMLVASIGVAGYSLNNYGNTTLVTVTNGAQFVTGPTALWFSDYYELPPGGGLWFWNNNLPGGVYSDKVGVFWVAQPQGGTMTFSVSTEAGPWVPMLTLNGYSPTAVGEYTNVVIAPDFHRLRLDGVSGTNYVIGPQLLSQTSNGVHVAFMDKGGIAISDVTNVPSAIRAPIFAALSPDLLIWHMKEDGTTVTSNGLMYCEQWWSNAAPSCDVIYIGTPYTAYDTNPATPVTVEQNTLVRYIALQYNRAYCDLMNPSVSWPWMNSLGFMADQVHWTYNGGQYLAGFLWNEAFFALGTNSPPAPGYNGSFTAAPTDGAIPMTVTFADLSDGSITNWSWSFGDGGTASGTNKSVSHTYSTAGTYTVTEIVSGLGGATTNTFVNYITALVSSASFTATPTSGVAPLAVTFADESLGAITNWYWSFGDGATTNASTTVVRHTYAAPGTYTVTEIVSGPDGAITSTVPNCITATWPPPLAGFTAAPTGGAAPLSVVFSDASSGGPVTVWSWDFGDNSTGILATSTVSHTYSAAGNYTVTETVSGPGGTSAVTRYNYITVLSTSEAPQFQAWLTRYFNCTNCMQSLMNADADGTGQNNLFKYTAGLDPTNPASVFAVSPAGGPNAPGQFTFRFGPVVAGRVYAPQFCTNLSGGVWFPLADYAGPTTNNGQVTITDLDATQPSEFYRVAIALAPNFPSFAITSITLTGQTVTLVWNAPPGTNVVQVADDPSPDSFVDLASIIMPAYGTTNYIDPGAVTNAASRFYRINLRQ